MKNELCSKFEENRLSRESFWLFFSTLRALVMTVGARHANIQTIKGTLGDVFELHRGQMNLIHSLYFGKIEADWCGGRRRLEGLFESQVEHRYDETWVPLERNEGVPK